MAHRKRLLVVMEVVVPFAEQEQPLLLVCQVVMIRRFRPALNLEGGVEAFLANCQ
jgi:hypothetical protein